MPTLDVIVDRVRSVLVGDPFVYGESVTPFSFDLSPQGQFEGGVCRIEHRPGKVIGGVRRSEERTDQIEVWVARMHDGEPVRAHRLLTRDLQSITAAVVSDGHFNGGDYALADDGRGHEIRTQESWAYSVLRVTLPVNYETEV